MASYGLYTHIQSNKRRSIALLVGLFVMQRHGTAHVGRLFGPVMSVWFAVLGLLGAVEIAIEPEILLALNPGYGIAERAGAQIVALGGRCVVQPR